MAKLLKINAIKIRQGGPRKKDAQVFVATIKAKDIIDKSQFVVHEWDPELAETDEKQGYQRKEAPKRAQAIAKYLIKEDGAGFPNSILVSSRKPIRFDSKDDVFGHLVIGEKIGEFPLYVIDGQHRVAGYRQAIVEEKADFGEAELAVVFLVNYTKDEEMQLFNEMNTLQRKVDTSLAQRLLSAMSRFDPKKFEEFKDAGMIWIAEAIPVIDELNSDDKSVWRNKIALPNSEKSDNHIINQKSLVTSLKPLFSAFKTNASKRVEILENYWEALTRVFPEAFEDPKEYVIQKTPGVFSLHMILPTIVTALGLPNTSVENFEKILRVMADNMDTGSIDSTFWGKEARDGAGQYGSMKGFKTLKERFEMALEEGGIIEQS